MTKLLEVLVKIECQTDNENKIKTFSIDGELDSHNVKTLKSYLTEIDEINNWTYILDMKKTSYMDSSGLGMLVYIKKELHKTGNALKIINLSNNVFNVFKMTKLDAYFELL